MYIKLIRHNLALKNKYNSEKSSQVVCKEIGDICKGVLSHSSMNSVVLKEHLGLQPCLNDLTKAIRF